MTSHTIQLGNISKSQTFFLYWIGKILFKFNTTREFKENSTLMKVHSSNFFYGPIISDVLIPSLQCRQSIPTTLNEINTFAPKRTEGKAHLRLISSTTFPKNIYIYIHTEIYTATKLQTTKQKRNAPQGFHSTKKNVAIHTKNFHIVFNNKTLVPNYLKWTMNPQQISQSQKNVVIHTINFHIVLNHRKGDILQTAIY